MPRRVNNLSGTIAVSLAVALACGVASCTPRLMPAVQDAAHALQGRVAFEPAARSTQATLAEVANGATVSLIDTTTGNTVASSLTDAGGNFTLTFANFTPQAGTPYVLEAVKGLQVTGNSNRAGTAAARLRTLLFWNAGWQSLTNSTVNVGITISTATTAISTVVNLKKQAGTALTLSTLIGKVSGSTFTEAGTGLTNAADFTPVLGLVSNAITLDQDPLRAIAFDKALGVYSLATGVPWVSSFSPTYPSPGGTITVTGNNLDKINGRNAFFFGAIPASTWSVSANRTTATVTVPGGAFSAPFVMQQPNGLMQTITPFLKIKGTVGTLAGAGTAGWWDTVGANALLNGPFGIEIDSVGNLYTGDEYGQRIRKISPAGVVTSLAGDGTVNFADGAGTAAKLNYPCHLAIAPNNNLFFCDAYNQRIRMMTPAGVVSSIAGNGTTSFADGTGAGAAFNNPTGVAMDGAGNLYVADASNYRIRMVTQAGVVTTLAGSGVAGSVDGTGAGAQIGTAYGVVADPNGNLYVAEQGASKIRKIVISTAVVSTLAGSGTAAFADGQGTAAMFKNPHDIAIDGAGNLYVADNGNYRIRKISPSGYVSTVAGTGTATVTNGATSSASFRDPTGLCVDNDGNIYVADRNGNCIRVITP